MPVKFSKKNCSGEKFWWVNQRCYQRYSARNDMYRSHTCGELQKNDIGKTITLAGWVHRRRDHGNLIFIDLRDRYGLTQVTFDPEASKEAWEKADKVRSEYVVKIKGKVMARPQNMINPKISTGEIEVEADEIEVLNKSKTPPFEIADEESPKEVKEEVRLKYRYLDIRKEKLRKNIEFRHKLIKHIRDYLEKCNFLEIETPILTKSTPEGARDFIVPSRLHPSKFYALPQSPQQYKQLLMIGGIDKYFQIAPCMRDEDARADRSSGEFYQLDLEMSFVEQEDVLKLIEELLTSLVQKSTKKRILFKPWPRFAWKEVMLKYGTDKPDLRFATEIEDLGDLVKNSGFEVFSRAIREGGVVRAICAKGGAKLSRTEIDGLTEFVKEFGAKGLAYIKVQSPKSKVQNLELVSPIIKYLGKELGQKIARVMKAEAGDIIFFAADREKIVREVLGNLRVELAHKLNLIDPDVLAFAYIVDFPLFEEEFENGHYAPSHHMFTAPKEKDIPLLDKDPHKVRSYQHDLVCNGYEVGGGSIRIHNRTIQKKIFDLIGFSEKKQQEFAHMLEAFEYGAPPHGGIALGIERLLMIILGELNVREVIAFPKTGDARDLMMDAPSEVEEKQLKELHVKVTTLKH